RGTFKISGEASAEVLIEAAKKAGTVGTHLRGREPRRIVVVPGKAVNFVP
ncbi:unnamed protein product, partial [marine sediment metagenome]